MLTVPDLGASKQGWTGTGPRPMVDRGQFDHTGSSTEVVSGRRWTGTVSAVSDAARSQNKTTSLLDSLRPPLQHPPGREAGCEASSVEFSHQLTLLKQQLQPIPSLHDWRFYFPLKLVEEVQLLSGPHGVEDPGHGRSGAALSELTRL